MPCFPAGEFSIFMGLGLKGFGLWYILATTSVTEVHWQASLYHSVFQNTIAIQTINPKPLNHEST